MTIVIYQQHFGVTEPSHLLHNNFLAVVVVGALLRGLFVAEVAALQIEPAVVSELEFARARVDIVVFLHAKVSV